MRVRLPALPISNNQINQPSDKGYQGNKCPQRLHANGAEVLAGNIDDCRDGEYIEDDTDFYPEKNSCNIQLRIHHPFNSADIFKMAST